MITHPFRPRVLTQPLGYTLVELLVTIALASVLLSVAVPSFRNLTVSNRLTTQANEFVAAIALARSEAIKRNASVTLCRASNATATACAAASGDWTDWIVRSPAGTVIRRGSVNTGGGLEVTSTLTNDTIVFGPDGLAMTNGVLVNDHVIRVCSPAMSNANVRTTTLGAGSRVTTEVITGTCS